MFNSLQNSTLVQSYNLNDHLSADDTHSMYRLWPPPDIDCSLNQFRDCILDSFHWMIESSYIHARMHACYIHKCMHAYTHARRNARTHTYKQRKQNSALPVCRMPKKHIKISYCHVISHIVNSTFLR